MLRVFHVFLCPATFLCVTRHWSGGVCASHKSSQPTGVCGSGQPLWGSTGPKGAKGGGHLTSYMEMPFEYFAKYTAGKTAGNTASSQLTITSLKTIRWKVSTGWQRKCWFLQYAGAKKLIVQGRAGVPWQKASRSCGHRPPPAPRPLSAGRGGARLPSSGHCCFGISSGLAAGPWDGFRAGARGWEKGEAVGMSSSPAACPLQAPLLVAQRLIQSAQLLRGLVLLVISLSNISCKERKTYKENDRFDNENALLNLISTIISNKVNWMVCLPHFWWFKNMYKKIEY